MAELDRVKEEIGWLKVVFGLLVATDLALVGWLAQNFGLASGLQVVMAVLAVLAITGIVVWLNLKAYIRIEQLEKL